jgi:hypothetical protein
MPFSKGLKAGSQRVGHNQMNEPCEYGGRARLLAFDPNYPGNATYGAAYASTFKQVAQGK